MIYFHSFEMKLVIIIKKKLMNRETVHVYEAPQVEIIEVDVEKGFATSGGPESLGEEVYL